MAQLQTVKLTSLPTDKCSFGCAVLDEFLAEGVPCGNITELAGESTVAKSQTCMQLLLQSQIPKAYGGLDGCAVYVYTEGEPSIKRMKEMAAHLRYKHPPEALARISDPLANIFIEKGFDTGQDLLSCLHRIRRLLQQPRQRPVRLIVVDSITHLFRDLGDKAGVAELASRTEMLFRIAAMLKRYAHDYNLAVVVTNQVTDAVKEEVADTEAARFARWASCGTGCGHTSNMQLVSSGREVLPALGLAWANCVNTRLFLSRYSHRGSSAPVHLEFPPSRAELAAKTAGALTSVGGPRLMRVMEVVFSPHLPHGEYCFYVLEPSGLRGIHPDQYPDLYAVDYTDGFVPSMAVTTLQHEAAATAQRAQRQDQAKQQQQQSLGAQQGAQDVAAAQQLQPPQLQQQQQHRACSAQHINSRPHQLRRLSSACIHQNVVHRMPQGHGRDQQPVDDGVNAQQQASHHHRQSFQTQSQPSQQHPQQQQQHVPSGRMQQAGIQQNSCAGCWVGDAAPHAQPTGGSAAGLLPGDAAPVWQPGALTRKLPREYPSSHAQQHTFHLTAQLTLQQQQQQPPGNQPGRQLYPHTNRQQPDNCQPQQQLQGLFQDGHHHDGQHPTPHHQQHHHQSQSYQVGSGEEQQQPQSCVPSSHQRLGSVPPLLRRQDRLQCNDEQHPADSNGLRQLKPQSHLADCQEHCRQHSGVPAGQQHSGRCSPGVASSTYNARTRQQQVQPASKQPQPVQQPRLSELSQPGQNNTMLHSAGQGPWQVQGAARTPSGRRTQSGSQSVHSRSGRGLGRLRQQQQQASRYGVVPLVASQHSSQSARTC